MEIDHDLYSRQIYVLGDQAMQKLSTSNVLLYGLGGLGIEIAKNIVLAGIKSLTLMDDKSCTYLDLGSQFFVKENHVLNKINRAEASLEPLKQLNPYVKIDFVKKNLNTFYDEENSKCLEFLNKFNCVILTDADLNLSIKINEYCHSKNIMFIMSEVYGLFGWSFTDFGDKFDVFDTNGEEHKEQFIGSISKDVNATIATLDDRLHNLESGDFVKLTEVEGMIELNNKIYEVKVLSPTQFLLLDANTQNFNNYSQGGLFKQVKQIKTFQFKSLKQQLHTPDLIVSNYAKMLQPYYIHAGLTALTEFADVNNYEEFLGSVEKQIEKLNSLNGNLSLDNSSANERLFKSIFLTKKAKFPPLCAIYGGIVAQEVLKCLTNRFTPIKQWLHFDCFDLYEPTDVDIKNSEIYFNSLIQHNRYDSLRVCFGGEKTLNILKNSKLFMVGCGAIGCEMLKNYATLGIACENGLISVTDNDLIEKSNLNRQFLFRQDDIRKAKSVTAANATIKMNPDVKIKAYQEKVCPQSEKDIFTDKFFLSHDICVNALDNIEARRYVDNRCVANQRALIESGTLGTKGHVQVIIPYLTESYTTQRDPQDEDIPYCTLKSFPANIEHCIQWSRDKFESSFTIKPVVYKKFFTDNQNINELLSILTLQENLVIDGSVQIAKVLKTFCYNWDDCIRLARHKFEKYFSNKAKNLLYSYPLDHLTDDSTPFWKLPRRPPHALQFDVKNELHLKFIQSCARLYADLFLVHERHDNIVNTLTEYEPHVPTWKPSGKKVEIDEAKLKEQKTKANEDAEINNLKCAEIIKNVTEKLKLVNPPTVETLHFEKDDDKNGHIDFIYAASNLRASMYSIESSNRSQVKKIAGKIVPAIATTTSCIAGFVSIELIKILKNETNLESYNNIFLNLALSLFLMSEPGKCEKRKITNNCFVTLWDKWIVKGKKDLTLRDFMNKVKQTYNLTVSGVINGAKAIYIPVMPGHAKRVNETMLKLIKGSSTNQADNEYVDLTLTYSECDDIDDGNGNSYCPQIRYFFYE